METLQPSACSDIYCSCDPAGSDLTACHLDMDIVSGHEYEWDIVFLYDPSQTINTGYFKVMIHKITSIANFLVINKHFFFEALQGMHFILWWGRSWRTEQIVITCQLVFNDIRWRTADCRGLDCRDKQCCRHDSGLAVQWCQDKILTTARCLYTASCRLLQLGF